jgi:hypothetical protein
VRVGLAGIHRRRAETSASRDPPAPSNGAHLPHPQTGEGGRCAVTVYSHRSPSRLLSGRAKPRFLAAPEIVSTTHGAFVNAWEQIVIKRYFVTGNGTFGRDEDRTGTIGKLDALPHAEFEE